MEFMQSLKGIYRVKTIFCMHETINKQKFIFFECKGNNNNLRRQLY